MTCTGSHMVLLSYTVIVGAALETLGMSSVDEASTPMSACAKMNLPWSSSSRAAGVVLTGHVVGKVHQYESARVSSLHVLTFPMWIGSVQLSLSSQRSRGPARMRSRSSFEGRRSIRVKLIEETPSLPSKVSRDSCENRDLTSALDSVCCYFDVLPE